MKAESSNVLDAINLWRRRDLVAHVQATHCTSERRTLLQAANDNKCVYFTGEKQRHGLDVRGQIYAAIG